MATESKIDKSTELEVVAEAVFAAVSARREELMDPVKQKMSPGEQWMRLSSERPGQAGFVEAAVRGGGPWLGGVLMMLDPLAATTHRPHAQETMRVLARVLGDGNAKAGGQMLLDIEREARTAGGVTTLVVPLLSQIHARIIEGMEEKREASAELEAKNQSLGGQVAEQAGIIENLRAQVEAYRRELDQVRADQKRRQEVEERDRLTAGNLRGRMEAAERKASEEQEARRWAETAAKEAMATARQRVNDDLEIANARANRAEAEAAALAERVEEAKKLATSSQELAGKALAAQREVGSEDPGGVASRARVAMEWYLEGVDEERLTEMDSQELAVVRAAMQQVDPTGGSLKPEALGFTVGLKRGKGERANTARARDALLVGLTGLIRGGAWNNLPLETETQVIKPPFENWYGGPTEEEIREVIDRSGLKASEKMTEAVREGFVAGKQEEYDEWEGERRVVWGRQEVARRWLQLLQGTSRTEVPEYLQGVESMNRVAQALANGELTVAEVEEALSIQYAGLVRRVTSWLESGEYNREEFGVGASLPRPSGDERRQVLAKIRAVVAGEEPKEAAEPAKKEPEEPEKLDLLAG